MDKTRLYNYKYLLNRTTFLMFSFTHTKALYIFVSWNGLSHSRSSCFPNFFAISELDILYRLEKMGVGTKNGDNYKSVRHK